MFHVQTEEDLKQLQQAVPQPYFDVVAAWFNDLREASPCEELGAPFVLDSGSIHALDTEAGDGLENLQAVLESWVEYTELLPTSQEGLKVWKIVVMSDNDWIDTFFVPKNAIAALDTWAEQYLERT